MRTCTICSHSERAAIDQLLVTGTSLRNVARQFGTSATALYRHKKHLAVNLVKAEEAGQVADAGTLLEQVKALLADAQRLTMRAEQAKQIDVALRGIREIRGVLELLAKVSSELAVKERGLDSAPVIDMTDPGERKRRIAELLSKAGVKVVDEDAPASIPQMASSVQTFALLGEQAEAEEAAKFADQPPQIAAGNALLRTELFKSGMPAPLR